MYLEDENPIVRQTIFIINSKLSYQFDVNQTIHIHSLKKMIAAAANLQKNNFFLIHNNTDYTDQDDSRLMSLFPGMQTVTFYIQKGQVEELDESVMKIRLSQYCPLHEFKYLSYYCFNCGKSICSLCINDKVHQYHNLKEKCDYLQSSKHLVDFAFKNNLTINMDPKSLKQSEKISLLSEKIHKVFFGKLYEMLKGIEGKFDEIIEYYNKTNKTAVNNMQDNLILFKKFCVKGLDELKEEVGIQKIMIDEEVFLGFHNRYIELINQQVRVDQDLKKFTDLNNVLPSKIEELAESYYSQIYKLLYELLMSNTYHSLMTAIREKDVGSLEEKDVVTKIVGNIKTFFEKSVIPKDLSDTSNSNIASTDFNLSNVTKRQQNDKNPLFINTILPIQTQQGTFTQLDEKWNKTSSMQKEGFVIKNPFIANLQQKEDTVKEVERDYIMCPVVSTQNMRILYKSSKVESVPVKFTTLLGIKSFLPSSSHANHRSLVYISGGIESNVGSRVFLKYDFAQNNLIRLPDMEYQRYNHSLIGHEDNIYAIGGNESNTCEKYSLTSVKWTKMSSMIARERRNPMLYIYNNYLYAFLGKEGKAYLETIEKINIRHQNAQWEKVLYVNSQNINLKYYGCALHEINNELYFFGGMQEEQLMNKVFSFDFNNNVFAFNEQELDWKQYFIEGKLEKMGKYYSQIASDSYVAIFLDLVDTTE